MNTEMKPTSIREDPTSQTPLDRPLTAPHVEPAPAERHAPVATGAPVTSESAIAEVEGFSLQVNRSVGLPPMLKINFGDDMIRMQSAAETNEQTRKLVTRVTRSRASMADNVVKNMR